MRYLSFLLFAMFFVSVNAQDIPFEGDVELEDFYEGEASIKVKVTRGPLSGKTEVFYFKTNQLDTHSYKNNSELGQALGVDMILTGRGDVLKVKGIVYKKLATMYNPISGEDFVKEIYRIKELHQLFPAYSPIEVESNLVLGTKKFVTLEFMSYECGMHCGLYLRDIETSTAYSAFSFDKLSNDYKFKDSILTSLMYKTEEIEKLKGKLYKAMVEYRTIKELVLDEVTFQYVESDKKINTWMINEFIPEEQYKNIQTKATQWAGTYTNTQGATLTLSIKEIGFAKFSLDFNLLTSEGSTCKGLSGSLNFDDKIAKSLSEQTAFSFEKTGEGITLLQLPATFDKKCTMSFDKKFIRKK